MYAAPSPVFAGRRSTCTRGSRAATFSASSPVRRAVVHDERVRRGHAGRQPLQDPLDVLRLVIGGHDDQHAVGHRPLLPHRRSSSGRTAATSAPAPTAVSAHSGLAPSRCATVVELRWAICSTNTAGSNRSDDRVTVPSGATIAEIPLVAATATVRPNSTARSRLIASCCSLSSVKPKVALLVWTTIIPAPSSTTSRTRPS